LTATKENQHYVPKMLLRNFAIQREAKRGREQVHVLDKTNSRAFIANIRNIASAFDFYEAEMAGQVVNAERILGELEGYAASILQKIINSRSVASLDAGERRWFSIFCAVQFVRTQTVRDRVAMMNAHMEDHIRRMGYDPKQVEGFESMSEDGIKAMTIRMIAQAIHEYPPIFDSKVWFLMDALGDGAFLIGDHPVTLHNDRSYGPYGNLGLAIPGIQIFLPLAPDLTLAMWCPTIFKEFEDKWREPRQLVARAKQLQARGSLPPEAAAQLTQLESSLEMCNTLTAAAKSGGCMMSNADNTTMLNSLQVMNSSRFLMADRPNFELAERMFSDNPKFRSRAGDGLRIN
jgi:hypothetical protein